MKNWPVLFIAVLLGFAGALTLIAPDSLLGTYPQHAVFQTFGRLPIALYMLATAALMFRESLVSVKHYIGIFMGVIASIFWAVATVIPLFIESIPPVDDITVLGMTFKGPIDTVAVLAWTTIAGMLIFYYLRAKELTRSLRRARL